MNPRLISHERLQVATPRRDARPFAAFVALLIAIAAAGFVQRGTDPSIGTPRAIVQPPPASPAVGTTTIHGTAVPAPPVSIVTASAVRQGGLRSYATTLSNAEDDALFAYYLQTMPAQGWTLLGKGDPTRTGAWSQRWQAGPDAALLTVTTQPRDTFSVELCPPDPYC